MGPGSGPACDIRLNTQLTADERRRFQNVDTIRRLLREVRGHAADSLKLAVVDLPGKSHVEVLATFTPRGARTRTLSVALPRYEAARLAAGFAEAVRS